jgi:hypothetical protein
MLRNLLMQIMAACLLLVGAPRLMAEDSPYMKGLHTAVTRLVQKHYPKAKVTLDEGVIHFEYNTRKFMIHEPLLTGEWQDAAEQIGPQKDGIIGNLVFQPGKYGGMATVPQSFDKRYFVVRLMAPYSEKLDGHLLIHVSYPRIMSPEFLDEFEKLTSGFNQYLSRQPQ